MAFRKYHHRTRCCGNVHDVTVAKVTDVAVVRDIDSHVVYLAWDGIGKTLFWPEHVICANDEDELLGKVSHHEVDSPLEIPHVSDSVLGVGDHVGASYVYTNVDGVRRQTKNITTIYLFINARTCQRPVQPTD